MAPSSSASDSSAYSSQHLPELTLRGCLIATLITIVFTASNIYLGLKVGLTFSSAIPSAVISMAVLKLFKKSNILENCAVQTFASSAGTLSAIIFILPGLVILGYWQGFPYWQTAILCAVGGLLGVMYTIPLRHALVVDSDLPFPEGTAAAEVLKIGCEAEQHESLHAQTINRLSGARDIVYGACTAAAFSLCSSGFKLFSDGYEQLLRIGNSIFGIGNEYSLAILGAGYLIGMRIALSILLGVIISWGIALPYYSSQLTLHAGSNLSSLADGIWATKLRYIGVGTIAVAAVWTMLILLKPIWQGIAKSMQNMSRHNHNSHRVLDRTERDIPMSYVITITALLLLPLLALFGYFIGVENLNISSGITLSLVVLSVFFAMGFGFLISAISGYLAGITGSSNSPVSGIAILAVIAAALLINYFLSGVTLNISTANIHKLSVALAIFMTSVVMAVACISNDNLQDLKTGQLVGATPWKQQFALILGVLVGSLVIPPILEMIYQAYGFVGAALPHAGMNPSDTLAAPQAVLMSTLAHGIITHQIHWDLLAIGAIIGVALIILDQVVLRPMNWTRISIISVGIGIYLPISITLTIVLGAVIGWLTRRKIHQDTPDNTTEHVAIREGKSRRGVLFASGFIVGESLLGVLLAGIIMTSGSPTPLRLVGSHFQHVAAILGFIAFASICYAYYRYIVRR